MNLPQIINDLVNAQNHFDSTNFVNCFSETANVVDESKTYTGKAEIKNWIEISTKEYNATMKPLVFEGNQEKGNLKAEVSGTFPGSPLVLNYNFKFEEGKIQYLEIN